MTTAQPATSPLGPDQEKAEELGILDKACRQCANELAQMGVDGLRVHAQNIAALLRKLERLQ